MVGFFYTKFKMKVLFFNEPLTFSCIPRRYTIENLSLTLRNELTDVVINPNITHTIDNKLNITIETQPTDFQIQNKYEFTLKDGDYLLYSGKLIVLKQNTDVQNYEYNTQNNEYFQFKE
jgi:hypothetical protein